MWLWYLNPYLQYVFTAVLFVTSGKRIRMIILLYCMISTYDMIISLRMKLGLYLHAVLRSFPYLGSYVLEFVSNQTQSVGKTRGDAFPHSFKPPLSFRLVLTAFENFKYPWDAQTRMFLLLCLLNKFQVLFRVKQVVNKIVHRPAQVLDSYEKVGMWHTKGKCLGQWTPSMSLKLTPEKSTESRQTSKISAKSVLPPWKLQRHTNHCNVLGSGPRLPSPVQSDSVL